MLGRGPVLVHSSTIYARETLSSPIQEGATDVRSHLSRHMVWAMRDGPPFDNAVVKQLPVT